MLVIRLRRTGKKGQPSFRIVVADQRKSVYSPYIEMLGTYDPNTKKIILNKEKTLTWINKGAKPSNTIAKILEKEGLKHKSIVIKKFRAISKKELEVEKAAEEVEKAKEQAEKEAAKEAFEAQVEAEKKEQPQEDKLQEAANEAIAEVKEEDQPKADQPVAGKAEESKPETPEKTEEETKK